MRRMPFGCVGAAGTSSGTVSVLCFNRAECIHSFSSGVLVLANLAFLPSSKYPSEKETKEKGGKETERDDTQASRILAFG